MRILNPSKNFKPYFDEEKKLASLDSHVSNCHIWTLGPSSTIPGCHLQMSPCLEQPKVLASPRDRIITTPSIMMNMMTIMIAIYWQFLFLFYMLLIYVC